MAGKMGELKGRDREAAVVSTNNDQSCREDEANRKVSKVAQAVEKVAKKISNRLKHAPH